MNRRQTSIKDVAKAAGVSFKTVARVLNHEPNVRPALRERVFAAAAALGYAPNVAARDLAGGRSHLIGLMFDNPSESYISRVQTGAIARCHETGQHLVVEPLDPSDDARRTLDLILSRLRVDGLILTPPVCDNRVVLDAIERAGVRYVRIAPDQDLDRAPRVVMDDEQAAREMTRRLIALGHRDIGFIQGHPDHGATRRRQDGFLAALAEAGLSATPDRIAPGAFSFESGMVAARRLIEGRPRPTAIFASNDDMALGALSAAAQAGLNVPGDLSIAGFDDSEAAQMAWPMLTTVRQPIDAMSAAAVDLILDPQPSAERRLDYALIIRGSTAPPSSNVVEPRTTSS